MTSAADWDARYAAGSPWDGRPNVWVAQLTAGLAPARALDVAAGDGRHALWLAGLGWQVTALDFSATAVELGRASAERLAADGSLRGAISWQVADATTHAHAAASVDLVLVSYLHLPQPGATLALTHAAAALAPGGTFVLVGHDERNLAEGVGGPRDPAVLTSPGAVAAVLADAGLEVRRAEVGARQVAGADRPALDTVVLAVRPA